MLNVSGSTDWDVSLTVAGVKTTQNNPVYMFNWVSAKSGGTLLESANQGIKAVDNLYDYVDVSTAEPPASGNSSHKLIPLAGLDKLIDGQPKLISAFKFQVLNYPTKDEAINTLLTNSLESPNWAYNQARVLGGALPNHQPNWFRPKILINGVDILNLDVTPETNGTTAWRPFLAYGVGNAFSVKCDMPFHNIISIDVYAGAYQMVVHNEVPKWVRYPVYCELLVRDLNLGA